MLPESKKHATAAPKTKPICRLGPPHTNDVAINVIHRHQTFCQTHESIPKQQTTPHKSCCELSTTRKCFSPRERLRLPRSCGTDPWKRERGTLTEHPRGTVPRTVHRNTIDFACRVVHRVQKNHWTWGGLTRPFTSVCTAAVACFLLSGSTRVVGAQPRLDPHQPPLCFVHVIPSFHPLFSKQNHPSTFNEPSTTGFLPIHGNDSSFPNRVDDLTVELLVPSI